MKMHKNTVTMSLEEYAGFKESLARLAVERDIWRDEAIGFYDSDYVTNSRGDQLKKYVAEIEEQIDAKVREGK